MTKRVGVWVLITLLTLGVVAASVSFGFAQSGSNVELIGWSFSDDGPDPPAANNPEGKDVAWCEGELQDTDDDDLNDNFDFAIHDGYPGYECQVTLVVQNAGENEFDVVNIDIAPVGTSDITIVIYEPATPLPGAPWATLEAGETVNVVFTVYIGDCATPDTTYTIEGNIDVEGEEA